MKKLRVADLEAGRGEEKPKGALIPINAH